MTSRPTGITNRRVLAIALPIVLSNATIPLLGAADTAIVGQLGQAAPIGAVGLGAIILTSIYSIFGFLRMGTTGLVAQARGAGEAAETGRAPHAGPLHRRRRRVPPRRRPGGALLGGLPARPRLARGRGARPQLPRIRIWGAPAAIAVYALTGWLIGMERTRGIWRSRWR